MATRRETVEAILDALGGAGEVTARKMFGEYALYLRGKVVALVCDDTLFVKPTPEGRAVEPGLEEGRPYPDAKPHLVVPGEMWDEGDRLAGLLRATEAALPKPTPRRRS
ncbi:TfoX/Sxy family protein [Rubellimicrobium aerolatum]|uniref:TfoX/Sxy family protein n=1 Tax=Rubellimicrobium aerolatum TaxID=490979 RepID=A0ABW0SFQ4_9RHOB|nr:TfoX/Sxy family protein [Rubellimicrobium aerolatum]MBP1807225.1 TfoX/Sxy family transcriptional regulator of competence genes [Rubellimicrobium aerolatum]